MEEQLKMKDLEWEMDLLPPEDLTPLSQSLISPELALAFGITPEPSRTLPDLNEPSHDTCSMICPKDDNSQPLCLFPGRNDYDSNWGSKDDNLALKRPRLVWTPQLHKRFVDVIENLGIDKAMPKTIMEMMNVEGLSRENVASHLQKYRLYLRRLEGLSINEDHSNPNRVPLFECDGFGQMQMQPVPVVAPPIGAYGFGHLGLPVSNSAPPGNCGLEYGASSVFWNRQRG